MTILARAQALGLWNFFVSEKESMLYFSFLTFILLYLRRRDPLLSVVFYQFVFANRIFLIVLLKLVEPNWARSTIESLLCCFDF